MYIKITCYAEQIFSLNLAKRRVFSVQNNFKRLRCLATHVLVECGTLGSLYKLPHLSMFWAVLTAFFTWNNHRWDRRCRQFGSKSARKKPLMKDFLTQNNNIWMLIPIKCTSSVFVSFSSVISSNFQLFMAACVVKRGHNADSLFSTRLTAPKPYNDIQTALTCVSSIQNVWVSTSGGTRGSVI